MAVNLSPVGGVAAQFFDNSGQVLTGGKLYTYLAGTTTPAVTYTTNSGLIANSNPIVLNAAGRVADSGEIWLTDTISYKFVLKDTNNVQIATWDNVTGINSNSLNYTLQEQTFTATQGQTAFTLTNSLQYTPSTNSLAVFVNGSKQIVTTNYTETSTTVFTFLNGLNVGDVVDAVISILVAANVVNAVNVIYNPPYTSSVSTNVQAKLAQMPSVKDFGAKGDGTTNDVTAFTTASNNGAFTVPPGTYLINSSITINSPVVFQSGAILKPASGVVITFYQPFSSLPVKIFDLSLGGTVTPSATNRDVYAEWWGAKGDAYLGGSATLNNEVYIQQAINALLVDVQGVAGGFVLLAGGDYYVNAQINIGDGISIKGSGTGRYPVIFARTTGWAAGSYMFNISNGVTSMFNSTIENVRIDAGNQANIVAVINTVAWQEKCGLRNTVITNFQNYGLVYNNGYGGAAMLLLDNTEWFASASSSTAIIRVDVPFIVGYFQLNISNTTITGTTAFQTGVIGISVSSRGILNLNNVHFEALQTCISLQNSWVLTGQSVTASGTNDITNIISCNANWTGSINANYIQQCGATGYISDTNRPYPIASVQPYNGQLIWPPDPKVAFATALVSNGAAPLIKYGYGLTVSRTSAGIYVFTMSPAAYDTLYYNVLVTSDAAQTQVTQNSASTFTVYTSLSNGTAVDFNTLSVQVFHSP